MTYSPYFMSIAKALKNTLAPELQSDYARAVLDTCVKTLSSVTHSLIDRDAQIQRSDLPSMFQDPASVTLAMELRAGRNASGPPDHWGSSVLTDPLVETAEKWMSEAEWLVTAEARSRTREMLAWEQVRQQRFENDLIAFEQASSMSSSSGGRRRIDGTSVEKYFLKTRSAVKISDFVVADVGRSKQIALFSQEGMPDLPGRLVIRCDHPGNTHGTSVAEEFEIMQVVYEGGVRAPKPLLLETSATDFGVPFMVMEQLPGSVAGGFGAYFSPPRSEPLALALAEQFARLHSIPVGRLGAPFRSHAMPELDRVAESWHSMRRSPSITMSAALQWMKKNADCMDDRRAIVHGELQFHNVLSQGDELTGILDWEIAHVGHPAEDLGYCKPAIELMTSWDRFMEAYFAAGGPPVSPKQIDFFCLRYYTHFITLGQSIRNKYENGQTDDVIMTGAGATFVPQLHLRLSKILAGVLQRID